MHLIAKIMEWIPGCSPTVPTTWREATLQAFACFVRLVVAIITVLVIAHVLGPFLGL